MDKNKKEYTDFGYKEVPKKDKSKLVGEVFSSVASKYDLMNDVMSLGIHRLWKKAAIESSQVMPGNSVLDVAGGTGDLAIEFSKIVGSSGSVVLSDINEDMLAEGKKRVLDSGRLNVDFKIANAEELPFEKNSFDCISIAFGIRNVTDKEKALKSMFHCLKPGGRLIVLEFSKPTSNLFSQMYEINDEIYNLIEDRNHQFSLIEEWDYALEEAELCFKLQPTKKHFELLDLIKQRSELESSGS